MRHAWRHSHERKLRPVVLLQELLVSVVLVLVLGEAVFGVLAALRHTVFTVLMGRHGASSGSLTWHQVHHTRGRRVHHHAVLGLRMSVVMRIGRHAHHAVRHMMIVALASHVSAHKSGGPWVLRVGGDTVVRRQLLLTRSVRSTKLGHKSLLLLIHRVHEL